MGSTFDSCLPKTGKTLAGSQSSVENDVAQALFPQLGPSHLRSLSLNCSGQSQPRASHHRPPEKGIGEKAEHKAARAALLHCCTRHAQAPPCGMWDAGCAASHCGGPLQALAGIAAEPKLHVQRREAGKDVLGWLSLGWIGPRSGSRRAKEGGSVQLYFLGRLFFWGCHPSLRIASSSSDSRRPAVCCSCVCILYP